MSVVFMNFMMSILALLAMLMLKRIRSLSDAIKDIQVPAVADRQIKRLKHLVYYYIRLCLFNMFYVIGTSFLTIKSLRVIPINNTLEILAVLNVLNILVCGEILLHAILIDSSPRYWAKDATGLPRRPVLMYVVQIVTITCLVFILIGIK